MKMRKFAEKLGRTIIEALATRPKGAGQRGMTLVEVMVVVVIISMVAGIVGVQVFGRFKDAQRKAAFIQIKDIGKGLELYKLSSRRFPSTAEGLQALTQPVGGAEPVMNSIPNDPWGAPYVYIFPGTQNTTSFDILSYGPDGVQGGGDDVTNWDDPNAPKE